MAATKPNGNSLSGAILDLLFLVISFLVFTTVLRTLWASVARYCGLWIPEHFRYWIWIPWRGVLKLWVRFTEWLEEVFQIGKGSTAGFAGFFAKTTLVFRPGYVLLGRLRFLGINLWQPLGFKAVRHLAMIAGTGSGKTTFLITILALHKGNVFVIDPKGQITEAIARRRGLGGNGVRGLGQNVAILDPYNTVKSRISSNWNALDELTRIEKREGKNAVVKYTMKIAEAIVPMDGDKPYFPKNAREFLQALILHVYTTEPPKDRHLVRVRELATRGYHGLVKSDPFGFLLSEMQHNNAYGGAVANAAASLAGAGKSLGDILSTLRSALKFLDLPEIRDISLRSDFSLEDVVVANQDLFVCGPLSAVRQELSGWFRLLAVFSLDLFEKIDPNLEHACLFAVDEMPSLGYVEAIETSAPVMRSYGVRLLAIAQDLERLRNAYPQGWRGFLGNADAVFWMGTNEDETAEHLSKSLGDKTRRKRKGLVPFFRRIVSSDTRTVITADQVKRVLAPDKETMIITRFGKRALVVGTMPYFWELPVNFYDPDPAHREGWARAFVRSLNAKNTAVVGHTNAAGRGNQTTSITYSDALQVYGLVEPFTIFDLDKRKAMLIAAAKNNGAGDGLIIAAYKHLKSNAKK